MALIIEYLKVFKLVVKNRRRFAFDMQLRVRHGRARELQLCLCKMVVVNMAIPTRPHKIPHL